MSDSWLGYFIQDIGCHELGLLVIIFIVSDMMMGISVLSLGTNTCVCLV